MLGSLRRLSSGLHRSALGLTPYDRRRLEWQIETTEDAKDRWHQAASRDLARTEAGEVHRP